MSIIFFLNERDSELFTRNWTFEINFLFFHLVVSRMTVVLMLCCRCPDQLSSKPDWIFGASETAMVLQTKQTDLSHSLLEVQPDLQSLTHCVNPPHLSQSRLPTRRTQASPHLSLCWSLWRASEVTVSSHWCFIECSRGGWCSQLHYTKIPYSPHWLLI